MVKLLHILVEDIISFQMSGQTPNQLKMASEINSDRTIQQHIEHGNFGKFSKVAFW